MINFELPAKQVFIKLLANEDYKVKETVVWALVRISDTSVIPNIAQMLNSQDKQIILLAQDALAVFSGNINDEVAKVIANTPVQGKVASLELLAIRRADNKINTVLEQTKASDSDVKMAAYKTLKSVVTAHENRIALA